MKLHIRLMFLLFMLCALFVSTRAACNAEEAKEVKASDLWEKVYEYDGPVDGSHPTWCGKDALLVSALNLTQDVGGWVYVNLITKKKVWVTRDLEYNFAFCSYDGTMVFLHKMDPTTTEDGYGEISNIEDNSEFHESGVTRWAYEIKTRKMYDYGGAKGDLYYIMSNASPSTRIYANVTGLNDYFDRWGSCNLNLPTGWKILCLTPDEFMPIGESQWANDGSYIALFERGNYRFTTYDETGVKLGTFDIMVIDRDLSTNTEIAQRLAAEPRAMSDGVYYFKEDGILRRVNVPSGTIDVLPVKVPFKKDMDLFAFDVSAARKEVAYTNSGRHELGGLYIATFDGKTSYQLSETGALARYSPTGEYLAFLESRRNEADKLVVYKRKNK